MSARFELSDASFERILANQLKEHPEVKYQDEELRDLMEFILETVHIMINVSNEQVRQELEKKLGHL